MLAGDDEATRDEIARSLGAEHDVTSVRDGAAALALARQESWDLVLANKAGQAGCPGAASRALAEKGTRALPLILLPAHTGEDRCAEAMAAGAVDYLTTPVCTKAACAHGGLP